VWCFCLLVVLVAPTRAFGCLVALKTCLIYKMTASSPLPLSLFRPSSTFRYHPFLSLVFRRASEQQAVQSAIYCRCVVGANFSFFYFLSHSCKFIRSWQNGASEECTWFGALMQESIGSEVWQEVEYWKVESERLTTVWKFSMTLAEKRNKKQKHCVFETTFQYCLMKCVECFQDVIYYLMKHSNLYLVATIKFM